MVNYTKKTDNMAGAKGIGLGISTKQAVETCSFIRGKTLVDAKGLLSSVIDLKAAVPYKRYNQKVAHKKKIGAGRYPVKCCNVILKLLESAEANAQFKGLNTSDLVVVHICANKASTPWHYGRARGRKMKRTNIEVVLEEKAVKKKDKPKPKEGAKKPSKGAKEKPKKEKAEAKQEIKKEETRKEQSSFVSQKPGVSVKPEVKEVPKQEEKKESESNQETKVGEA